MGTVRPTKTKPRKPQVMSTTENTPDPGAQGAYLAGPVARAVDALERTICGAGASTSAAIAEGRALMGARAACLFPVGDAPVLVVAPRGVPWVAHRLAPMQPLVAEGNVFELSAGSAQEAVDHVLVAHRAAIRSGTPGVCTLAAEIGDALHIVELPGGGTIAELLGPADVGSDPGAALGEALAAVSARLGRKVDWLSTHRMEDADHALVAAGAAVARAREAADILRTEGVKCGVVGVAVLRPLPAEALRKALVGMTRVAVVGGAPTELVDAVLALEVDVRVAPGGVDEMFGEIGRHFDVDLERAAPGPKPNSRTVLGAAPAGPSSEALLLDVIARLGPLGAARIDRTVFPGTSAVAVGRPGPAGGAPESIDLLFAAHPSHLAPEAVARVRNGGALIVQAACESGDELWQLLGERQREAITERGLKLSWLDLRALEGGRGGPGALRAALHGAVLAKAEHLADAFGADGDPIVGLVDADLLRAGASALSTVAQDEGEPREVTFRPEHAAPRMQAAPDESDEAWRRPLRHFHLTGQGAAEVASAAPLTPALLGALQVDSDAGYPLVLLPGSDPFARPFAVVIGEALDAMDAAGSKAPVLREHLTHLAALASATAEASESRAFSGVVSDACAKFVASFDVSDEARATIAQEVAWLAAELPDGGTVLAPGRHVPAALVLSAARRERAARLAPFAETLRGLATRLAEILAVDAHHGDAGLSANALASSLGTDSHINPAALAKALPKYRGSTRLAESRKRRIEAARSTLVGWLLALDRAEEVILVHGGPLPAGLDLDRAKVVSHPDALGLAIGIFDGIADEMVEVLRAVRVARLEVEGAYEPELHDEMLERFDWRTFTGDELLLLPRVVVLEDARRLRGEGLASLSALLRAGRPVEVVVPIALGDAGASLEGTQAELGYLAVAHREALVLQSSVARVEHLSAGIACMARSLRPSLAVVGTPAFDGGTARSPLFVAAVDHAARATPCFCYDPEAGTSLATRLTLADNPQPERIWPELSIPCVDAAGAEQTLTGELTFAHAAALEPALREHFRTIPREAWNDEQVELGTYLAAMESGPPRQVPFLWVIGDGGALDRAVITRELAFACRDRARTWRILQELAGTDNEHARRAAAAAREEALAEAAGELETVRAQHDDAMGVVRQDAAREAMDRLVSVLMDLDSHVPMHAPAARPAAPAPAPAVEAPAAEPASEPAPAAAAEEDEGDFGDEPYVDSILCTTCNECTNLNGMLFKYNGEKQAYIADVNAGTFLDLVRSAEKCPAKCIHVGKPRSDDASATPEVLARAAKL